MHLLVLLILAHRVTGIHPLKKIFNFQLLIPSTLYLNVASVFLNLPFDSICIALV